MTHLNPLKLLGTVDALLIPIQRVLSRVLPDHLEEALDKDEVRVKIVDRADSILIKEAPEARLVPEIMRKRIMRKTLDIILDDILLPDEAQ